MVQRPADCPGPVIILSPLTQICMPAALDYLECPTGGGHRLRVDFYKVSDRYGHRLSVIVCDHAGSETVIPLAESVEGVSDDPWPPSPALQSLSIEEFADGRSAALLVGMAGKSHWSASFEVETVPTGFCCAPKFKLACRFSSTPTRLGSTYRVAPGIVLREHKGVGLYQTDLGIAAAFDCNAGQPIVNLATGEFQFPVLAKKLDLPATAQWEYMLMAKQLDPAELRKKITA